MTMSPEELEIRRFELEQKVKLEELALRKQELALKTQEQQRKRISTPLILSIVGGLITLITGITLNYFENSARVELEDKKFQSSLLLKATDAESYEDFSNMLITLQENGLLSLDSTKLAHFRKSRFVEEDPIAYMRTDIVTEEAGRSNPNTKPTADAFAPNLWTVVSWKGESLEKAQARKAEAEKLGFDIVIICERNGLYGICLGQFTDAGEALGPLFDAREALNNQSYLVRLAEWCPDARYDEQLGVYSCNS